MRFYPLTGLLLVVAISCNSFHSYQRDPSALKAPSYHITTGPDGDPVVKKKPGDPDYVDPSLQDDKVAEDVLIKMRERLMEISSITMEDIEPAKLAIPDYNVANKSMRSMMKDSVVRYFDSLEAIKKEVVRVLSELLALKREADQESDPKGLMHEQYELDVKSKIPTLNKKMNEIYVKALDDLYSLGGNAVVPAGNLRRGEAKDPFKVKRAIALNSKLYGLCSTSICIKKLESNLEEWHSFVRNFNNDVSFSEFGDGKAEWTKNGVNTSPLVTIALIDAAQDMLKLGLKKNKDYSIPGVIAKAGADTLKAPAGVAMLLLSAPVYLFEKTSKVIADVLSFHVMKVKLSLKSLDSYDEDDVKEGFRQNVKDYAATLSNSAIYVAPGEEDKSDAISVAFRSALAKAIPLTPQLMDFFSAKELVDMDTEKIMTFSESLSYLSQDRLILLKEEVSEDKKFLVQVALYERNPESLLTQSLDEIVKVLTASNNVSPFKKPLDLDPALKAKIFAKAPDLQKKLEAAQPGQSFPRPGGNSGSAGGATGEFKQDILGVWRHENRTSHILYLEPKNDLSVKFTVLCWGPEDTAQILEQKDTEFAGNSLLIHWLGQSDSRKMLWTERKGKVGQVGYSWSGSDPNNATVYKSAPYGQNVDVETLLGTWERDGTHRVRFVNQGNQIKMQVLLWGGDTANVNTYKDVDFYGNMVMAHWLGRSDSRKMIFTTPPNLKLNQKIDYMWNCNADGTSFVKIQ